MTVRLGFDIGGTFTDLLVLDDATDEVIQEKVPTTPAAFAEGAINGIEKLRRKHDVDPARIEYLAHGTTVATNAMIERTGATTGLITTEGFRDLTPIGREKRRSLYDTSPPGPPTFTERRHRVGVAERISSEGEVIDPIDPDEVAGVVDRLAPEVDSIAVSLLHAHRNPEHERVIAETVRERTDLPVFRSSAVMPEIREYERTITTVINAYVEPIVRSYIDRLEAGLRETGVDASLHLMQANGGITVPEHLDDRGLQLINSGPAAGVIGAKRLAELSGITDIITLDVGGTSADTCVVRDGAIETTTEGEIEDIPLQFPQVDVRTVGAGGGSIAAVDRTGVLKVGPASAGANPGPACYGRGGEEPTVTDAALVLGYLDPEYFLGGEMALDTGAADRVIDRLAAELDMDKIPLADGVLDVATTNMAQAVRLVTVEKGYDPREFALVCYGGAGPMFATRLAERMAIDRVLIPTVPGVLSASGLLAADKRYDVSKSNRLRVDEESVDAIAAVYDELAARAREVIGDEFDRVRTADLRYAGQTFQLTTELPSGEITPALLGELRDRFAEQYESTYGHRWPDKAVEAVTWRLRAVEPTEALELSAGPEDGPVDRAVKGERTAYADGEVVPHTVYDRYALPTGVEVSGPAIVEETESTTVIGPGATFRVDPSGNLLIERDAG